MRRVGIISEYNPMHPGHTYQIRAIRETFGTDTAIVAIMSGNYTQRGELALTDKFTRAKCAILGGADLVLELPFPFCLSSAEYFANAGVSLAADLGLDTLSFGSETGDLDALVRFAQNQMSEEYRLALSERLNTHPEEGYPISCEAAYREVFGDFPTRESNDILAVSYIKANLARNKPLDLHTVKREGAAYRDLSLDAKEFPSAAAIRLAIANHTPLDTLPLPEDEVAVLKDAAERGYLPADPERIYSAVCTSFLINDRRVPTGPDGGLYTRIANAAAEARDFSSLVALSETKKFTTATIRRAIFHSYFGVTSSDLGERVRYTQLLAANGRGLTILKEISRTGNVPVLTKPSDVRSLSDEARRQKARSDAADKLYLLSTPRRRSPADALRFTPYVEK